MSPIYHTQQHVDIIKINRCIANSREKQAEGCIVVAISLVCVLFDPAIPTSFFNFIQLFLYLFIFIVCEVMAYIKLPCIALRELYHCMFYFLCFSFSLAVV